MPLKSYRGNAKGPSCSGLHYKWGTLSFSTCVVSGSRPALFPGGDITSSLKIAHKDANTNLRNGPGREQANNYILGILNENMQGHLGSIADCFSQFTPQCDTLLPKLEFLHEYAPPSATLIAKVRIPQHVWQRLSSVRLEAMDEANVWYWSHSLHT